MNKQLRFIIGVAIGLVLSSVTVALLSSGQMSLTLANMAFSIMTFLGIALGAIGYVANARGNRSILADFIFGIGVGFVIVAFIGAGNGTLSF